MRATIGDVAAIAGVSRQTVSNTINAPERVRPDTRERVLAAIAELKYRPNLNARRLRTAAPRTVAMRITQSTNGFHSGLLDLFLHCVTEIADANNLHVLVFTADDDEHEVRQITELAGLGLADAFVISGTGYNDVRVRALTEAGHRFVAFGRPWGSSVPDHRWVDVDGHTGTRDATEACLEVTSNVAFVGWPEGSGVGDERRSGWETALSVAGHSDKLSLQVAVEDSVEAASSAAATLLDAGAEAFVCASDSLAFGVLAELARAEKDCPVVGFDDSFMSEHLGFASVNQNIQAVATEVVALLGFDQKEPTSHSMLVTPRLVRREAHRWGIPLPGSSTTVDRKETS